MFVKSAVIYILKEILTDTYYKRVRIISTLGTNRLGTKRPWVRNVEIIVSREN